MGIPVYQNGDRFLIAKDVLTPLVKGGYLLPAEGERLLSVWSKSKEHPLNLAVTLSLNSITGKRLTQDEILTLLSEAWKLEYQRVDLLKVSLETVGNIIPHPYADRLGIVPIEMTPEKVTFLTAEPFALSWMDEVKAQVKRPIEIRLSSPRQVKHLLNEIFIVQKAFKGLAKDQGQRGSDKLRLLRQGKLDELDALIEKSKGRALQAQDGFVAKIVDWLINFAIIERASDIHLEPKKGLGVIRFRVDGDLRTVYRLDHDALMMVIARFKIL